MRGIQWNIFRWITVRYLYKRSKFVKNACARYGVHVIHYVRVINTSKGMSKNFGVRVIHRCALSTGKYGNIFIEVGRN
jgi:hypothetical protein